MKANPRSFAGSEDIDSKAAQKVNVYYACAHTRVLVDDRDDASKDLKNAAVNLDGQAHTHQSFIHDKH
ncbi:hypothetical protein [Caballeronia arvi]|uniref:hypothetical protein n=1 Tax=Caballeronia arvi TaxID=1777135 RepID=UPI0007727899|nr:hypothetical protein [Caballeronia arvi]